MESTMVIALSLLALCEIASQDPWNLRMVVVLFSLFLSVQYRLLLDRVCPGRILSSIFDL